MKPRCSAWYLRTSTRNASDSAPASEESNLPMFEAFVDFLASDYFTQNDPVIGPPPPAPPPRPPTPPTPPAAPPSPPSLPCQGW